MNRSRTIALLMAVSAAGLLWACGPKRVRTPQRSGPDLIVLLPDAEGDTVGRVSVSNTLGTADLATARDSTQVADKRAPAKVTEMSEADVRRLFGDVLSALPPPPQYFTLFFRFESDELTDESRALVPDILKAVKDRPVPEVAVIGHTDRTGTPASNFELGLKRANMVRSMLINVGLAPSFIEVASHGEADPLVPTADEVYAARNRRVEITIR
jgi:outer membrane protein OmpA-like peptidoglycan-associated protein